MARANPAAAQNSNTQPGNLLDPAVIARFGSLELVTKQLMDGYVQGLHRSPHVGFALDFAQHRQYVPGDDVKRLDWRVYAKANRYYIKLYEVSTNLNAYIILDASGSMGYKGQNDPMSKFRYGQSVAAALAYLALHQQDSAGLITLQGGITNFIPPRSTAGHLMHLISVLESVTPENETPLSQLLHESAERIKRRGMVIIISDFFDKVEPLIHALHHLRHKRHDVVLMQVMSDDELTFPFRKWSRFENLERGDHRLRLDPALVRAQYMQAVGAHIKRLRQAVNGMAATHVLMNTSQPFDGALSQYLVHRMGRK